MTLCISQTWRRKSGKREEEGGGGCNGSGNGKKARIASRVNGTESILNQGKAPGQDEFPFQRGHVLLRYVDVQKGQHYALTQRCPGSLKTPGKFLLGVAPAL